MQSEYDKRCEELNRASKEVMRLNIKNASLLDSAKWQQLTIFKCFNKVDVVIKHNDNFILSIKTFKFDPKDFEDYEFAIREAEELIETIKKA